MRLNNMIEANAALATFIPKQKSKEPYTLMHMRALMDFLGNPQDKLKVIHVAGTSGKTSTCYYVAALLKKAGYRVGLTISPHVSSVNDRLQINLEPLSEPDLCRELGEFLDLIEKSGIKPSYFEVLVALAYWEFDRQRVDWAVVEVGLGGLLDGTNVINRPSKVCVITDIGFDHVNVLGRTLPEIAEQKAGIIQPSNVVFSYQQSDEIMKVLQKVCAEQKASLKLVDSKNLGVDFDFLPLFQQHNFGLARAVVNYVLGSDDAKTLAKQQIVQAAKIHIPARMEIFKYRDKTIILDGAHNAQKLHALITSIKKQFAGQQIASLVSFAAGDEYRLPDALQEIANASSQIIVTSFAGEQDAPKVSVKLGVIKEVCAKLGFKSLEIVPEPEQALTQLLDCPEPMLLVAGSFYLLNHIRPLVLKLEND